jgi:epimerase transport system membrane fusion protein
MGSVVEDQSVKSGPQKASTDVGPVRLIGMAIIFLIFGVFGTWAVVAPLDSAAIAPGIVTIEGNRKTIQHLEGGIISKIFVNDGDTVNSGDPLIQLDETQAKTELQILRGQLFAFLAMEARLIAERNNADSVNFPAELLDSDTRTKEARALEMQQFTARKASHEGEIEILQQRSEQLKSQLSGLTAQIRSKANLSKSYAEEIQDNKALLSEGFVNKQRLRDLQRSKQGLAGEIAEHRAAIAGIKVQMGETRLQILQLGKNFSSEVISQLSDVQAKLFDINERISATDDRVTRSLITAPVGGVVLGLSFHTVGGVVAPANPILDIVPEGNKLIIEAKVTPVDIDRVNIGLEADIRFSAFKSAITPVVQGSVITVSPDILTGQDGISYYLAKLELTPKGEDLLQGIQLVPGMPAEVLINTGSRTLFQYLAQPATDAFARSLTED